MKFKIIEDSQIWDYHKTFKYTYLDSDNVVGSYNISEDGDRLTLQSLYIQPKYRGRGISHIIMADIIKQFYDKHYKHDQIWILIHKDNWVKLFYEGYGFVYQYDENNYYWMKKDQI